MTTQASLFHSAGRVGLMGLGLLLVAGLPVRAEGNSRCATKKQACCSSLKAENQADGSVLVTFELIGTPKLSTVIKQGQSFSQFTNLEGFVPAGAKGFPEMLYKQANVLVDPSKEYEVELVEAQSLDFTFEHPYLPSRGTILRSQNPDKVPYEVAKESRAAGFSPAQIVEHGEGFFIRNVAGYNFRFALTQVDANSHTAKVHKKLVFRIKPVGGTRTVIDSNDPSSRKVVSEMAGVVKGLFLNNAPATGSRAAWSYEVGDKGDILVLHTSRDTSAIQPYIDHKRNKGYTVTSQAVAVGTNVKTAIQNAYASNKNLLYVQLVGDWADLKCDTIVSDGETCAVDNALGLVSGNDNFFDLIVGRFSGASSTDITTQVNKAIAYENAGAAAWKKKGLGMASNEGAGSGDDKESDVQHEDIIKNNKLLAKGYTSVASAYDTTTNAPLSASTGPVNAGLGVINYTGHGIHDGWNTTGINNSAVNSLTNGAATPIIFSVACVVGQYNSTTCFGETWLRKQNGGAVAAVMSTIYQPWLPPMRGQDYMNDLLTGGYNYATQPGDGTSSDHGKGTVGSIAFNAFNLMLGESQDSDSVRTTQSWVVFGDAALSVVPGSVTPPSNTAPSITSQPASKSVSVGQTATFSVTATGTAPLSYQWYKNNAAISGATASSYTTPATVAGDNGATFYVKVSNSVGSVNSSTATLSVGSTPPPSTTNLAQGKAATVSSTYSTYAAANAVDGSTSTSWAAATTTPSQWIYVNLGSAQTVGRAVAQWSSTYYPKSVSIQYYNGTAWTTISANQAATAGTQTYTFTPTSAQYWRVLANTPNSGYYQLFEYQLFAK